MAATEVAATTIALLDAREPAVAMRRRAIVILSVLAWGAVVTAVEMRTLFLLPEGTYFGNHSGTTCLLRVLEFRDCLGAGYWSPQWCTDFRQGFGSPDFGFYQPGFFYAASAIPASVGLVRGAAIAVSAFSLIGYFFTYLLVSRRFGMTAGVLAGTVLALAEYGATNLYIRGDLSEFSAMMLVPVVLFYLDGVLETPTRWRFAGLAVSSGILVIMHCCVALVCYAFMAIYLFICATRIQLRCGAMLGICTLSLGAGLAAFYWFPVIFEWNLVSPGGAFTGPYHFAGHFVEPIDLAFLRNPHGMPVYLGLMTLGLAAFNIAAVVREWNKLSIPQQRLFWLAGGLCGFAALLMNPWSAPIWSNLPLLYRLQFPWRLLALLSPGVAIIAGCLVPWRDKRIQFTVACLFMFDLSVQSLFSPKHQVKAIPFIEPNSAAELAKAHFAPDDADEWLPAGAKFDRKTILERVVSPAHGATARNYIQRQGVLECDVTANQASHIDLPHLFFPGWTAWLDGQQLSLARSEDAMMRVRLPANCAGRLQVRFSMTPMRAWGLTASAGCALVLLIIMIGFPLRIKSAAL